MIISSFSPFFQDCRAHRRRCQHERILSFVAYSDPIQLFNQVFRQQVTAINLHGEPQVIAVQRRPRPFTEFVDMLVFSNCTLALRAHQSCNYSTLNISWKFIRSINPRKFSGMFRMTMGRPCAWSRSSRNIPKPELPIVVTSAQLIV